MDCTDVVITGHAARRMFQRGITDSEIVDVLADGELLAESPDDTPFPTCLMLGQVEGRPLHVVVATEPDTGVCYVVTVYEPDRARWGSDFRTRRAR